jgi:hypothetical protein
MTLPESFDPLLASIESLHRLIEYFDNQGTIIGGVAASLLGKPRLTADVDALILLSTAEVPRLLDLAVNEGLVPRLSDAEQFARQNRVVLLRHEESGINVDISLGLLPFEIEAVKRSEVHQVGSIQIRLPTPEDLIILKAVAHRPKDMIDIAAVIDMQPELWVRQFADLLEIPEIWTDVESLLNRSG